MLSSPPLPLPSPSSTDLPFYYTMRSTRHHCDVEQQMPS
jgi:hypothetical protein